MSRLSLLCLLSFLFLLTLTACNESLVGNGSGAIAMQSITNEGTNYHRAFSINWEQVHTGEIQPGCVNLLG